MKLFNLVILASVLINFAHAWFCSAYCKPNQCTGISKTECTDCDSPFILSLGNCNIDVTSTWFMAADTSNITISPVGTGPACSVYSFNGPFDSTTIFTLTHTGPISIQHSKIRLILWIIMYDEWKPASDYFLITLLSTG